MNSRIENGELTLKNHQTIVNTVRSWVRDEDAEMSDDAKAYFFDGEINAMPEDGYKCISYWADNGNMEYERKIYFPEEDTLQSFRNRMIFDEKVKDYLDPDAVAEFIYNCIDVNALACVQCVAFLYDEPILDKDGEIESWKETTGRQKLMDMASDGCDEYAFEVGLEKLGINWVERSAVIINVSELLKSAEELSVDVCGHEGYTDDFFREGLIQTICHEFRHAVYEINEFTPKDGSDSRYPANGGIEENVEAYGNDEADFLLSDKQAREYINAMLHFNDDEKEKERYIDIA